jgi:hypothetical protein
MRSVTPCLPAIFAAVVIETVTPKSVRSSLGRVHAGRVYFGHVHGCGLYLLE